MHEALKQAIGVIVGMCIILGQEPGNEDQKELAQELMTAHDKGDYARLAELCREISKSFQDTVERPGATH